MLFMIMVVNRDIRERFTLSCVVIETQCYKDDQYKPGTKRYIICICSTWSSYNLLFSMFQFHVCKVYIYYIESNI